MNTSIFYVNEMGMMCQWRGQVIASDETSITIRFFKAKAFKFDLKNKDIDFVLITQKPVKCLGVCVSKNVTAVCFDDQLKQTVLDSTKGNVAMLWSDGQWQEQKVCKSTTFEDGQMVLFDGLICQVCIRKRKKCLRTLAVLGFYYFEPENWDDVAKTTTI